jgi:hypothetical protein
MIKDEILNFIQGGKEPPKPMKIDIYKAEKAPESGSKQRPGGISKDKKKKGKENLKNCGKNGEKKVTE